MWRHPIGQWLNFDRTRALELTQALKLLPWAAAVTARVIYVTRQIQHKWSHYMLIWLINLQPCFCAKCCVIWGKWTSVCLSLKGRNVLNIRFLEANCDAKPPTAKGVDHRRIVNWTSRSVTCHETGRWTAVLQRIETGRAESGSKAVVVMLTTSVKRRHDLCVFT